MRPHFTAFFVSERPSHGQRILAELGATVLFERMETAITRIRGSASVAADIIVIDSTVSNSLAVDEALRPLRFTESLLDISELHCMSNGVRWKAVPIAYVTDELGLAEAARLDWKFDKVNRPRIEALRETYGPHVPVQRILN